MDRRPTFFLTLLLILCTSLTYAQESEHGIQQLRFNFNGVPFMFSFETTDTVWQTDIQGRRFATLHGFYVGTTEITRRQYDAIMKHDWQWPASEFDCDSLPATGLTRKQWQDFLDTLNRQYLTEFRIPTRDEWNECYHGGSASMGYKYSGSNHLEWVGHTDGKIHPVGQLVPNELELYDMDNNAKEYVNDEPFNQDPLPDELPFYGLRMVLNSVLNIAIKE